MYKRQRENLDSDRHFGMELELTHRNKIGEVGYNLKGIATVTRQKYLTASEKGPWANSYGTLISVLFLLQR